MTSRRWLVLSIATIAVLLLVGRVLSGWYVDYEWYALHGATRLWWARAMDYLILRGSAFLLATAFVFVNLFTVRLSVKSLRLPRRVGNLEFSEEVSARILNSSVFVLSMVIGLVLAMPHDDWMSVELIRHGLPFGETDPYFRIDLGQWLYRLPLEADLHAWSIIGLMVVTLLVVFLYALTPSLRWESGRLQVSGHVRRHLFSLAAMLLVLLAWGYRLDAFGLLHEGTGPLGAISAVDHRIGIPSNLGLAILAIASAMLVAWTGWIGQTRVAFVTITVMLLAALAVRQVVPAVGGRFVTSEDPEALEQSYREIRHAYTRRAYAVDAVERATLTEAAPAFDDALRGASLWDEEAMRRLLAAPRQGSRPNGSIGWEAQDGRLVALALEQPFGPESAEALPAWRLARVAADLTDDRGSPVPREDPSSTGEALRGIMVHDSATTYYVLSDSGHLVLGRSLDSFASRLAHAWHLQNASLLGREGQPSPPRILLRRDVRERIRHLYPFLSQGTRVTPVVWRDSVHWVVHLYGTSGWYPLSAPQDLGEVPVRYATHAAVAIVNGHTGRVTAIASPDAGPLAGSWMKRFPELFQNASTLDAELLSRLPPPNDGALIVARALALAGLRGEFETRAHLPGPATDSAYAPTDPAPWLNRATGEISLAIPLLDPTEDVRGVIIARGGGSFRLSWVRGARPGPRWTRVASELRGVADSAGTAARVTRPVTGAIRLVPTSDGFVALQTSYVVRPDGAPQVLLTALRREDGLMAGRTLMEAAGLPDPVVTDVPLTPEAFRQRVNALYEAMREAMRRGDWSAIGSAWEALGRLLRSPRQP